MPKPLRSENSQPTDEQFKHFGVLDSGHQSKGSLLTAVITNVLLALIAIILGAAVHTVIKPKDVGGAERAAEREAAGADEAEARHRRPNSSRRSRHRSPRKRRSSCLT